MREFRMIMSNIASTRRTVTRLAGRIQSGEEEDLPRARLLLDAAKVALQAHKLQQDYRVLDELAEIRRALKAKNLL